MSRKSLKQTKKNKKLEDAIVETAAYLIVRAICGVSGFLFTFFFVFRFLGLGHSGEFYAWLIMSCIGGLVGLIIGPPFLNALVGSFADKHS